MLPPRGTLHIATVARVPIYAHWSILLGMFLLGGRSVANVGQWFGFIVVILVHEFGHVWLFRKYHYPPALVYIHGFGGECRSYGSPTPWEASVIAWGGIVAQAALWNLAFWPTYFGVLPSSVGTSGFFTAILGFNVLAMGINLIPVAPLDGHLAWQLPWLLYQRLQSRRKQPRRRTSRKAGKKRTSSDNVRYLRPPGG